MEVKATDAGYLAQIGPMLRAKLPDGGVLLRPLGNTIYVLPPYCTSAEDLRSVYQAIGTAVDE